MNYGATAIALISINNFGYNEKSYHLNIN